MVKTKEMSVHGGAVAELTTHEVLYYAKGRDDASDVRVFPLRPDQSPAEDLEILAEWARRATHLRAISYFKVVHLLVDLEQFGHSHDILPAMTERFDVTPTYVFEGRAVTPINQPELIYAPDRPAYTLACQGAEKLGYGRVVLCRDGSYMPFGSKDVIVPHVSVFAAA